MLWNSISSKHTTEAAATVYRHLFFYIKIITEWERNWKRADHLLITYFIYNYGGDGIFTGIKNGLTGMCTHKDCTFKKQQKC